MHAPRVRERASRAVVGRPPRSWSGAAVSAGCARNDRGSFARDGLNSSRVRVPAGGDSAALDLASIVIGQGGAVFPCRDALFPKNLSRQGGISAGSRRHGRQRVFALPGRETRGGRKRL